MPIATLDDLREHLQWALELEHATLPPYLCALYSIKPGTNTEASHAIASVCYEEMLHMTLAANLLMICLCSQMFMVAESLLSPV